MRTPAAESSKGSTCWRSVSFSKSSISSMPRRRMVSACVKPESASRRRIVSKSLSSPGWIGITLFPQREKQDKNDRQHENETQNNQQWHIAGLLNRASGSRRGFGCGRWLRRGSGRLTGRRLHCAGRHEHSRIVTSPLSLLRRWGRLRRRVVRLRSTWQR